jgi:antitoxin component YwqK of YwqJK toxin-antitoxin module
MLVSEYRDGKRHGPITTYYENGQVENQGQFRNGKLHGTWTGYWEDGAKKKQAEFEDGVQLRGDYFPMAE